METIQTISEKLRKFRQDQGLTLEEFAKKTGMNKGNLSKIENGKQGIGMPVLLRLLNALDCRIEIFPSSSKSTIRFYRQTSTVYRLTESDGMDYLCTIPALEERIRQLIGYGHNFMAEIPDSESSPTLINDKFYYTYTLEKLIKYIRITDYLPPFHILYEKEIIPNKIESKTIFIRCMTLHE